MRAIVYREYGSPDVLHIEELDKPVPGDNEILVRISAVHVNYGDIVGRNFKNIPLREFNMPMPLMLPAKLSFGLLKPKNPLLGSEFSGVIEAVGKNVKNFSTGDEVFGFTGQSMRTYAEYLCMSAKGTVAAKPENMKLDEACIIPYGAITAFNILKKVKIMNGTRILIVGASGSIGSYAVQFAGQFGAEVTGVCSTPNLEYVKAIGAEKVIDYKVEDFTKNGETYDVIFDVLGRSDYLKCKESLEDGGVYLRASFKTKELIQMLATKIYGNKRVICALSMDKQEDLVKIKELVELGKIKSVIDRTFTPGQAAEAHRYYESGNKQGPVIIKFI